eukprot:8416228-Ditylum_brightwellii.AAC.1
MIKADMPPKGLCTSNYYNVQKHEANKKGKIQQSTYLHHSKIAFKLKKCLGYAAQNSQKRDNACNTDIDEDS